MKKLEILTLVYVYQWSEIADALTLAFSRFSAAVLRFFAGGSCSAVWSRT